MAALSAVRQPAGLGARPASACSSRAQPRRAALVCRAQADGLKSLGSKLAAAGAAALLLAGGPALANEFDLLASGAPSSYIVDDASILNKTTKKDVADVLQKLQADTGFRVEAVTVRKLEFENDAFAFGDKLVKKWFPGAGDKSGVLLVVSSAKEGALTGGEGFLKAVGDDLIDSVVGDNIPILAGEEKFNEALSSSVARVNAVLRGSADPGPPVRVEGERRRTYKTKAETEAKKPVTATIVGTLLFISVVVPMLQYYGYTNKD